MIIIDTDEYLMSQQIYLFNYLHNLGRNEWVSE